MYGPFFYFDWLYFVLAIPPLILGLWAQARVKGAYSQFSKVRTANGINGAQAARRILDLAGLQHVQIERVGGTLSDHYDPRAKVLRLSGDVYGGATVASVGVAAHEAGHALQDKVSYGPMRLRSAIVPAVNFGSWLGPIIFMLGLFMSGTFGSSIAVFGILLFGLTAIFSLVTLPVEFDASKRAKQELATAGILSPQEIQGVDKVLDAAALTYVAAAVQSIVTVLYYVAILGRRR
ncbi:MAG: zinc metallopeptidase [Anaerolineales bacterium]|nr:zinc metallopeptidase [Anaerolineales bacterium]